MILLLKYSKKRGIPMKKMPAIFVGHGSPMIALDHNELTETYRRLGKRILEEFGKPKAILMVSAH